jgi:putative SOS response-associated peptidase YedK
VQTHEYVRKALEERLVQLHTVNADAHPVMRQFHKPGDEKRTPVIISPELHDAWLSANPDQAADMMTWAHMLELRAMPDPSPRSRV